MITFVFYNAFAKELGRGTGTIGDSIEVPFGTVYFEIVEVTDEDFVRQALAKAGNYLS